MSWNSSLVMAVAWESCLSGHSHSSTKIAVETCPTPSRLFAESNRKCVIVAHCDRTWDEVHWKVLGRAHMAEPKMGWRCLEGAAVATLASLCIVEPEGPSRRACFFVVPMSWNSSLIMATGSTMATNTSFCGWLHALAPSLTKKLLPPCHELLGCVITWLLLPYSDGSIRAWKFATCNRPIAVFRKLNYLSNKSVVTKFIIFSSIISDQCRLQML